jgi:hypothetical protein
MRRVYPDHRRMGTGTFGHVQAARLDRTLAGVVHLHLLMIAEVDRVSEPGTRSVAPGIGRVIELLAAGT